MYRDHPVTGYADVIGIDTQVIDVREPHEVVEGTLPLATNIPLGELPVRLDDLDPARRVVVVCRSGGRSAFAAEQLVAAGFDDVVNLSGGLQTLTHDLPIH